MVLTTTSKWIKFVSLPYVGKVHDLGYLGLGKTYGGATVSIPVRKSKDQEITGEQRELKRAKSKERVAVENAIGGMKRYRFLSDRLRCHDLQLYSMIAGIATGL